MNHRLLSRCFRPAFFKFLGAVHKSCITIRNHSIWISSMLFWCSHWIDCYLDSFGWQLVVHYIGVRLKCIIIQHNLGWIVLMVIWCWCSQRLVLLYLGWVWYLHCMETRFIHHHRVIFGWNYINVAFMVILSNTFFIVSGLDTLYWLDREWTLLMVHSLFFS